MFGLYARWIHRWETQLANRDTNLVVRPFEWCLDWLDGIDPDLPPADAVQASVNASLKCSEHFFSYQTPGDFVLDSNRLSFSSPLSSPYSVNNTVWADWFPAARRGPALLVLPQWNADSQSHLGLCKLLNRFGVSALRMTMAYHDRRKPAGLSRADYHVSANVGRTIHACRQSVVDSRACLDWLSGKGYDRLGVLGTSLGSCIAFIVAAHDARVRVGVFNHVSMNFGDVVWTGLSTRHVHAGFDGRISQRDLAAFWSVISPESYFHLLEGRPLRSLLIWTSHDTTFLPAYSRQVVEQFKSRRLHHRVLCLPCAHYTIGRFPFSWLDGLAMCRFARSEL